MLYENEKTLRNLGVIASIAQNDKMNTEGEVFSIYTPTSLRGVVRMYYGESRETNITRIQQNIRSAKTFITNSLSEIHTNENDERTSFALKISLSTQTQSCQRMLMALKDCIVGLKNLSATYREDASITSKLNILINEVEDFCASTTSVSQTSPLLEDRLKI